MEQIKKGMKLRLLKETGTVSWLTSGVQEGLVEVGFDMDPLNYPLNDGEYDAELVLESTTPVSFLWNSVQ